MAYTLLGAVYVPLQFLKEIQEETATTNELWTSGIIGPAPELAGKAAVGGRLIEMPFWQDLTGNSQRINSGTTLTVNDNTSSLDRAVVFESGKAWGAEDIAGILAQSDPLAAIATRISAWWARDLQDTLISILKGVFASTAMLADHVLAVHHTGGGAGSDDETNWLTAETAIDAAQLLGDAKDKLTAFVMHSAVEASLAKQDLIDYEAQSESKARIRSFQGRRVIVDDRCPTSTVDGDTVYTTYLFGAGAIGYEEDIIPRVPPGTIGNWHFEETRVGLEGKSALITRKRALFHPRGVKWNDSDGDTSPTNTQFENAANWTRVFEKKNVRLAAITHNI